MAKAIKLARANLNHPRVFNVKYELFSVFFLEKKKFSMPIILPDSVMDIASKVDCSIVDIVQYWYLKRKSRCGAPLIRRLQVTRQRKQMKV